MSILIEIINQHVKLTGNNRSCTNHNEASNRQKKCTSCTTPGVEKSNTRPFAFDRPRHDGENELTGRDFLEWRPPNSGEELKGNWVRGEYWRHHQSSPEADVSRAAAGI